MITKYYFIEDTSDHTVKTNQKTWRPFKEIKSMYGLYIFMSKEQAEEYLANWANRLRKDIKRYQEILATGRASSLENHKRVAKEEGWIILFKTEEDIEKSFKEDVRNYNKWVKEDTKELKQLEDNVFIVREIEIKFN